jgi:hypothetical protein
MQRPGKLHITCEGESPCKGWDIGTLQGMFTDGELVDLELRARSPDGEWISARVHSLIMALVSPVLRRMILWEGAKRASAPGAPGGCTCIALDLEEVESSVVGSFVEFVYNGFVDISADIEQLFALGKLADRLDVVSLRHAIVAQAQQLLTVDTCATFLQASHFSGLPELEERFFHFALQHFAAVSVHPSFDCLDQVVLEDLLSDDRLSVVNEEVVLVAILRWWLGRTAQGHDVQGKGLRRLLDCVRFALINASFLESEEAALAQQIPCSHLHACLRDLATPGSDGAPAATLAIEDERLLAASDIDMMGGCAQEAAAAAGGGGVAMVRGGSGPGVEWCRRARMAMELKP